METHYARKWRWLIFFTGCLEIFLFGGVLFGWGSLVYVLKQDGVFSHLCYVHNAFSNTTNQTLAFPDDFRTDSTIGQKGARAFDTNSNTTSLSLPERHLSYGDRSKLVHCEQQDNMLSLCFTVCAVSLYTTSSIAGVLSYKFGTRTARLVGGLSFTVGGVLIACTSFENPWLLFAGLPMFGFGGVVIMVTNIQIGVLFDKGSSTVIATLTGVYDTSSVVMLFVKFAHERGVERFKSFLALSGLHVLTLITTVFLMPRSHFDWTARKDLAIDALDAICEDQTSHDLIETDVNTRLHSQGRDHSNDFVQEDDLAPETKIKRNKPTLRECLLSPMFILEVMWVSLLQLRIAYFLGSLNPWLLDRLGSVEQVSFFTNVSLYMMMMGLLISLIAGATFDFFKHIFANNSAGERRRLYPVCAMLTLTTGLGLLMSVLALVHGLSVLYAVFAFTALLRSFLYSVDANVVTLIFPPEYFAALFGVSDFAGGAVSMLQYALFVWHETAGFHTVNCLLLGSVALTIVHPIVQIFVNRRVDRSRTSRLNSSTAI